MTTGEPGHFWSGLAEAVTQALERPGYDARWRATHDEATVATVALLYIKLAHLGLWHHVASESSTSRGCLEFIAEDVDQLRADLRGRAELSSPNWSAGAWSAREQIAVASLHLKHFAHWPRDKVQAHLDPIGLRSRTLEAPPRLLLRALRHWRDHEGYQDVERLRGLLLAQGLGREML